MKRFLVILCCLSLWQVVVHAATGTVRGSVTNGTKAGSSVEGLEVSLWTHPTPGDKPIATAKVGKDGRFEFANVPLSDKGVYEVRAPYGDAEYASDPLALTAQKPTATTQVTVYDPTTDGSHVVCFMHHIRVLEIKNGLLHVGERMIVLNIADESEGGRTYVGKSGDGGRRKVLRISLPQGAQNVEVKEEHRMAMMGGEAEATPLQMADDHYVEMSPLIPTPMEAFRNEGSMGSLGLRTVAYSYDLKPVRSRYDLSRSLDYKTVTFAVLSKDAALNVSAPALKEEGEQDIKGQTWKVRLGKFVEPNSNVEVIVQGRSFFSSEQGMAWLMAILIFVACVVGVVIGTRVRRGNELTPQRATAPAAKSAAKSAAKRAARQVSLEDERASLIEDIALLDERYESGEISQEQYQRERTTKKNRLIELTKRLQKVSS
jgi:hypothetical protein